MCIGYNALKRDWSESQEFYEGGEESQGGMKGRGGRGCEELGVRDEACD